MWTSWTSSWHWMVWSLRKPHIYVVYSCFMNFKQGSWSGWPADQIECLCFLQPSWSEFWEQNKDWFYGSPAIDTQLDVLQDHRTDEQERTALVFLPHSQKSTTSSRCLQDQTFQHQGIPPTNATKTLLPTVTDHNFPPWWGFSQVGTKGTASSCLVRSLCLQQGQLSTFKELLIIRYEFSFDLLKENIH